MTSQKQAQVRGLLDSKARIVRWDSRAPFVVRLINRSDAIA